MYDINYDELEQLIEYVCMKASDAYGVNSDKVREARSQMFLVMYDHKTIKEQQAAKHKSRSSK